MVLGLICDVKNDVFWYEACSECFKKVTKKGNCCTSLRIYRYVLSLEVETYNDVEDVTLFGPVLNQYFGESVDVFRESIKQNETFASNLFTAITESFVGTSCDYFKENGSAIPKITFYDFQTTVLENLQKLDNKNEMNCNNTMEFSGKFCSGNSTKMEKGELESLCKSDIDMTNLQNSFAVLNITCNESKLTPILFFDRNRTVNDVLNNSSCSASSKSSDKDQSSCSLFSIIDDTLPVLKSEIETEPPLGDVIQHSLNEAPLRRSEHKNLNSDINSLLTRSILEGMKEDFETSVTKVESEEISSALFSDDYDISSSLELFDDSLL